MTLFKCADPKERRSELEANQPTIVPSIDGLAELAERWFNFLQDHGYELGKREIVAPESFRGGFVLTFARGGTPFVVKYLDIELQIERGGVEIFGPSRHRGFHGNMFSREHLVDALPRVAKAISEEIRDDLA